MRLDTLKNGMPTLVIGQVNSHMSHTAKQHEFLTKNHEQIQH